MKFIATDNSSKFQIEDPSTPNKQILAVVQEANQKSVRSSSKPQFFEIILSMWLKGLGDIHKYV